MSSGDYDYGSDGDEGMATSSDDNDYGFDNGADVYAAQPKVRAFRVGLLSARSV